MKKALEWFNKLSKRKQEELSFEYYGTDILLNDDIEKIYLAEYRYYIELGKKHYLSIFPDDQKDKNKAHKTINEALDYMIELGAKEITVKN